MASGLLLETNLWSEFTSLFTEMSWIVIALFTLGIICCIIEAVIPGFGFFGITGILCEIAAVVVHAIFSQSAFQVFILLLIVILVILLIFLFFVRSARYGLIGKSPLVENKSAVPVDYVEKSNKELSDLMGKEGITITECRPVGKMRIGQDVYQVLSKGAMVKKGEVVKIVKIEDSIIYVDKISF